MLASEIGCQTEKTVISILVVCPFDNITASVPHFPRFFSTTIVFDLISIVGKKKYGIVQDTEILRQSFTSKDGQLSVVEKPP